MDITSITSFFFDNEDSINLFYYLLNQNISIDKIVLKSCTKMKNRINIQVTINNYRTVICPVKTDYHWFAVTRQHVSDISKLSVDDVHEFSASEEDYHKLFNFMWGDDDIFKNIKLLKDKVSNIQKILVEENNNF